MAETTHYQPKKIGLTKTRYRLLPAFTNALITDKEAILDICALMGMSERNLRYAISTQSDILTKLDVLYYLEDRYQVEIDEIVVDTMQQATATQTKKRIHHK